MDISEFLEHHVDSSVAAWIEFAREGLPESSGLSDEELADHARVLLLATAADIRTAQSALEQRDKSHGKALAGTSEITRIGREHAEQRFAQGFSLDHLLSEFRALRASVIRAWCVFQ